ncbi:MAG: hypothetical protein EXR71_08510 [Myxococcales bacterium]|nr:hypothetical protein [Myxococcales bacterium]
MITGLPSATAAFSGMETPNATRAGGRAAAREGVGPSDFDGTLTKAIGAVEAQVAEGDKALYDVGTGKHDYAQMMISLEEANISLRAMGSVRDKFVEAYQAVWNMPV